MHNKSECSITGLASYVRLVIRAILAKFEPQALHFSVTNLFIWSSRYSSVAISASESRRLSVTNLLTSSQS